MEDVKAKLFDIYAKMKTLKPEDELFKVYDEIRLKYEAELRAINGLSDPQEDMTCTSCQ